MYALTIVSSNPAVKTKYSRAQYTSPLKFRSGPLKRLAIVIALALDAAHYIRHRILRRYADAHVDSHQTPFYYLSFLVLRQLPEYFSKVLTQHSEYPLLPFLRYKYVILTVPSRMT